MRGTRILASLLALGALAASGCIGGRVAPSDSSEGAASGEFTDETGAVRGVVTDDSFTPLGGVEIRLDAQHLGATDESGSFSFGFVSPGLHYISAAKEGYLGAGVDEQVTAGQVLAVRLVLVPIAVAEAYYETRIQSGILACGGAFRLGTPTSSSTTICGNTFVLGVYVDTFLLGWNVGELRSGDVVGFWGETMWTSSQALGSGMQMIWFVSSGSPESSYLANRISSLASREGTSPVQVPLPIEPVLNVTDQQPTGSGAIVCQTGDCWLESGHYSAARTLGSGSSLDVGVTLQQRFDDFLTIFHKGVLPTEFSALPDR